MKKPLQSLLSRLIPKKKEQPYPDRREHRPIRMVIAGHDLKFTGPFQDYFGNNPRYELRIDEHAGHDIASEKQSSECLQWADVIFCEWALGNLVWYSHHKKAGQLLFSRLHLQEHQHRDRISYLYDTKWEAVDKLLLTSHHIYEHMIDEFPVLRRGRAHLYYCPIDACGVLNREKTSDTAKVLGMVGIVPQRKRLDLAIAILDALQQVDPSYSLRVKGHRPEAYGWMLQRTEEMAWYKSIYKRIDALPRPEALIFEAHGEDMAQWYTGVSFLLSTSDFEGSHQSVAESMATGCIPVIRQWEGADRIYPHRFSWSETEDAVAQILGCRDDAAREEASAYSRHWAQHYFDQQALCEDLDALILRSFESTWKACIGDEERKLMLRYHPRVLIVGYLPPGYRGGYRVRIEEQIRMLMKWGALVHFACLHPKSDKQKLEAHRQELETLNCPVLLVESDSLFAIDLDSQKAAHAVDLLERYAREQQIDVVQGEALYCSRLSLFLRERLPQLKFVFDCHGISPEEERMGGAAENRVHALEAMERRVLEEADLSLFVSHAMHRHFQRKYDYAKKEWQLLPCGVTESRFDTCQPEIKERVDGKGLVIAYAGTLAAWQCGKEMIRFFAQLKKIREELFFLLLIPEKEQDQARALLAQEGFAEEMFCLQELPHDKIASALACADVGVLLRRSDPVNEVSSPTKFGEYLAADLALILTDGIGDYSAVVKEAGLGVVLDPALLDAPTLSEADAEQLEALFERASRSREERKKAAQSYVRSHLHWDQQSKALTEAYGSLFKSPASE
ncbi:MAG: glycosyltransferase [Candidatus Hydrogenedentales bacterium]|jgi:glycosyltransferase involved in cell wall biosynthesis